MEIPDVLLQRDKYDLSMDAVVLYGVLSSLPEEIEYSDRVVCTIEQTMNYLNCGNQKACRVFDELEKAGLILRERRGQGKPNLIWVNKEHVKTESTKKVYAEKIFDLGNTIMELTVIRKENLSQEERTVIPLEVIFDGSISMGAIGVFSVFCNQRKRSFSENELLNMHSHDSEDEIHGYVKELEKKKYITQTDTGYVIAEKYLDMPQ